ncbi:MAG: phosphotransferase [Acidimicrobiales bacterium]
MTATTRAAQPAAFVKHYPAAELAAEAAKARLMAEAGESVGVRVPAVLDVDETTGSIRYEHVSCPTSLLDLMSDRAATPALILAQVEQAGAALGALHRVLPTAGFPRACRSERFRLALGPEAPPAARSDLVLQHGDFGYSNVRFSPIGELVVIDPSPNRYVSVDALNVDHPELDLALIASNFVGRTVRPVAMTRTIRFGPDLFAALLQGYDDAAGRPADRDRLRAYTRATVRAFADWCRQGRPQVLVPLARLLERNMP